jgi:hypothetical protein
MPNQKVQAAASGPPGALARPDWRAGGEFTAGDLRLEQRYFLQRLRRHVRLVHGWGVVCGLNVVAANDGDGWDLFVCPGYGIGPCGDEVFIHKRFRFNLRDYLWTQPVDSQTHRAWIAIEASEDPVAYEPAPGPACGCGGGEPREKVSLLGDGFRIVVSWAPPLLLYTSALHRSLFDVCDGAAPPCPACPDTCGLPLASVAVPSANEPILSSAITGLEEL